MRRTALSVRDRSRFPHLVARHPLWSELLDVVGAATKDNYGLEKARFVSPDAIWSKIQMTAGIASVTKASGGWQLGVDQVIEVEGAPKPELVSRSLTSSIRTKRRPITSIIGQREFAHSPSGGPK